MPELAADGIIFKMYRSSLTMMLIMIAGSSAHNTDSWPMPDPGFKNVVNSTNYPSVVDVIQRCNNTDETLWNSGTSTRLGVVISSNYILTLAKTKTPCNYSVLTGSHGLNHPFEDPRTGTEHEAELILYKNPNEKDHFTKDPNKGIALLKLNKSIELGSRYHPASLPKDVKVGDDGIFAGPSQSNNAVRTYNYFTVCNTTVVGLHECAPHIRFTFDQPEWVKENVLLPEGYFCVRSATTPPCDVSPLFIQGQLAGFEKKELYTDSHVHNQGLLKYTIIYDATWYRSWIKNVTGIQVL